jgi:putrescine importer
VWAGVGLVYLAYLTRRFRKPPPQFDAAKTERAWE